jgi:hypothetical protein
MIANYAHKCTIAIQHMKKYKVFFSLHEVIW